MNKFQMRQRVSFQDKFWYISGINTKIGYDFILYEYAITREPNDSDPFHTAGNCTTYNKWLREDELSSVEEALIAKRKQLDLEIAKLEKETTRLKEEKSKIQPD